MPTFMFNKIIREKFLEKLVKENGDYTSLELTRDQIADELKLKLKEEALEAINTTSSHDLLEELSDVLEVVEGLLATYDLTMSDLANARDAKQFARGKLRTNEKILAVRVPDTSAFSEVISYLRAEPHRYPEL